MPMKGVLELREHPSEILRMGAHQLLGQVWLPLDTRLAGVSLAPATQHGCSLYAYPQHPRQVLLGQQGYVRLSLQKRSHIIDNAIPRKSG